MNPAKKSSEVSKSPQKSTHNGIKNPLKNLLSGPTCLPLAQSLLEPVGPHVLVGLEGGPAAADALPLTASAAAAIAGCRGGHGAVGGGDSGGARVLLVLARHRRDGDDDAALLPAAAVTPSEAASYSVRSRAWPNSYKFGNFQIVVQLILDRVNP